MILFLTCVPAGFPYPHPTPTPGEPNFPVFQFRLGRQGERVRFYLIGIRKCFGFGGALNRTVILDPPSFGFARGFATGRSQRKEGGGVTPPLRKLRPAFSIWTTALCATTSSSLSASPPTKPSASRPSVLPSKIFHNKDGQCYTAFLR